MREADTRQGLPRSLYGLVAAMAFFWGMNWPILKVTLAEWDPMRFRSFCLAVAAVGLFAIARATGERLAVPRGMWPRLLWITLFNNVGWNVLGVYGIPMMDSGRAAILGYTFPVWSALITLLVLRQRIDPLRLFGVALGLCGMLLLLGDDVLVVGRAPVGTLLMLGAALSWAIGTVLISRYPVGLPLTAFAAWQTLLSCGLITVLSLIFEQGPFHPFHLSPWAQFGAWYNGLVSFIFCFWAWTKISSQAPPTVSSMATLMNPVIGVFSGMLILGERPQWKEYLALALVVLAMATVLRPRRAAQGEP